MDIKTNQSNNEHDDFWAKQPWQAPSKSINAPTPGIAPSTPQVENTTQAGPETSVSSSEAPPKQEIKKLSQEIQAGSHESTKSEEKPDSAKPDIQAAPQTNSESNAPVTPVSQQPQPPARSKPVDVLSIRRNLYRLNNQKSLPVDAFREAAGNLETLSTKEG